jgi:cargo-transport protein YPP1
MPHSALDMYEKALSHFPDHPSAIVGLCTILLDIYCGVVPPEVTRQTGALAPTLHSAPSVPGEPTNSDDPSVPQQTTRRSKHGATPSELNRLAARDRAYGLLSSLTKLGTGWDYSDAWFMLARAYEEGGQIEKAKEVLWWCVELEETKPLRHWHVAGSGALVL